MFRNYFKTALRSYRRQKTYSFINILGLSVGLACSFLILLWVQDELSFDRFHEHGDQIYRVKKNSLLPDGRIFTSTSVPMPMGEVFVEEYAEITDAVFVTWPQEMLFAMQDQSFRESGSHVSAGFFEVFTFPLLQGDPATVLNDPTSIVISESLAEKYFGPGWQAGAGALGQVFRVDNRQDVTVTGVFQDVPENSTLQFDYVMPFEEYYQRNTWLDHWGNSAIQMYVRLQEGTQAAAVNRKVGNIIQEHHASSNSTIFLQPYTEIYLYSDFENGQVVGGRIDYVRIFSVVAVFILLIAAINFMNLATARSSQRALEIGVRKAVGASQRSLVGQFMGESVLLALLALVLALALVAGLLPVFNGLTGKHIVLDYFDPGSWLVFVAIALLTGLVAGSYPALYLASFNVIGVLRNTFKAGTRGGGLRRGLVVFQFALSILLIIGALTVYRQVEYIRGKNLGLDRENLVYMVLEGGVQEQYDAFKQTLLEQPGIVSVTMSSQNPLDVGQSTNDPTWEGKGPEANVPFYIINGHYDFVETMKIELAAGRAFSPAFATDSVNYLINEEAARIMGMDDPLGQRLAFWGQEGQVVGIVKDFHISSLYAAIEPTIIRFDPDQAAMLFVRTEAGRTTEALASLEAVHARFNPGYPFSYRFLDENFEEMYRSEVVIGKLAAYFTLLAVFIACLGLFGLASFTAERRTKEIGIRKVLGASIPNLVVLLSREFIMLVAVAFLLTVPVAYYAMDQWLGNFAYRIDLGVGVFVAAGVVALLIAWLTVSYQSVRVASANPVKALRME